MSGKAGINKKSIILECTLDLLKRYGISGFQMDEVAKCCGMSKKTIYSFFQSKEEILENVTVNFITEEGGRLYNELSQELTVKGQIELILSYLFRMIEQIPYESWRQLKKKHPDNQKLLQDYRNRVLNSLEDVLLNGKRNNEIYPDVDISKATKLLLAELMYIHRNYRKIFSEDKFSEWQRQLYLSFTRSVLRG